MRRVVSVLVSVLVLAALATVGCGRSGDGDKRAEPTTTASPVSTTTTDPWAVPDQIDVAYVQRVVDELSRILTKAWQLARDRGKVDAEVERLVRSVDSPPLAKGDLAGLEVSVRKGFADVTKSPRPLAGRVLAIEAATSRCIVTRLRVDFSRVTPGAGAAEGVAELAGETRSNATGWRLETFYPADQPPGVGAPCARF